MTGPVSTWSVVTRVAGVFRSTAFAVAFGALLVSVPLCACGRGGTGGHSSAPTQRTTSSTLNIPINPKVAEFGQAFRLGKLTVVVSEAGTVPDPNPGGTPRRRLIVRTMNASTAPDRAPGLAIICEQRPQTAGGSLYADPQPAPGPFVAGRVEAAGAKDTGSITIVVDPACPAPALQVSPGGATINGLPGPVLISVT